MIPTVYQLKVEYEGIIAYIECPFETYILDNPTDKTRGSTIIQGLKVPLPLPLASCPALLNKCRVPGSRNETHPHQQERLDMRPLLEFWRHTIPQINPSVLPACFLLDLSLHDNTFDKCLDEAQNTRTHQGIPSHNNLGDGNYRFSWLPLTNSHEKDDLLSAISNLSLTGKRKDMTPCIDR